MKRICVFCGSSPGRSETYAAAASALGRSLVRRGIGLVYGGARVGLMGTLANAGLEAGGDVIGVIPQTLGEYEVAHRGLPHLRVRASRPPRKTVMGEHPRGLVA